MAEGKKSFVLYSDLILVVRKLIEKDRKNNTNNSGELFYHLLQYVSDENPEPINDTIDLVFEPIKTQLKRDLEKWENRSDRSRENGKKGGRPKNLSEPEETQQVILEPKKPDTVIMCNNVLDVNANETVNANDILLKKETKKSLLSEIKISDLEINEVQYFEIALAYQKLFIKNLKEKNAPAANQEKATYKNYVTPIRLMMSVDGVTKEQLTLVYKYLGSIEGEFWKSNILSTSKLREKFQQLLLKSQENGKSGNYKSGNTTPTTDELAEQSYSAVAKLLGRTQ